MTDSKLNIDLPPKWDKRTDDCQQGRAEAEYQYQTTEETTFIVSIHRQIADTEGYELRLSTINLTSNQIRHDYPIKEYERQATVFGGAESFIEHLAVRL